MLYIALVVDQSFNSWKPAVKLDLGEMCKLCFYFFSAVNTWLHIFVNTDSIFGEIYVFRFHLLCIRFLLLPTVNTLSIPYKLIIKWKQTSKYSQLDRVYVPIHKKIDKCTKIYAIYTVKPAQAATCIKRSPFACPVIEHFIWI